MIIRLDNETALEFWPELLPFVEPALKDDIYTSLTPELLRAQLAEGLGIVLVATDGSGPVVAAMVLQLNELRDGGKAVHIATLAGEGMSEWLPELMESVEQAARTDGAAVITASGRPGWAKMLNKYGYNVRAVAVEHVLDYGVENELRQQQSKVTH